MEEIEKINSFYKKVNLKQFHSKITKLFFKDGKKI